MNRKEFLKTLGFGAMGILVSINMESCNNSNSPTAASNVDFTLDLTDPANASLKTNGGYIYKNNVIIAKLADGSYDALSQACTHQGVTVRFEAGQNDFYCSAHGSTFDINGGVIQGPAATALKKYQTTLTGSSLRVFG